MNKISKIPRDFIAKASLPMLAIAASYGVFSYSLLFVPFFFAVIQAAAFEAVYIGLAFLTDLTPQEREKAKRISYTAVVVSIIYNIFAGLFHAQPQILTGMLPIFWLFLAFLHGAPLAILAYFVADLILHRQPTAAYASFPLPLHSATAEPGTAQAKTERSESVSEVKRKVPAQANEQLADYLKYQRNFKKLANYWKVDEDEARTIINTARESAA